MTLRVSKRRRLLGIGPDLLEVEHRDLDLVTGTRSRCDGRSRHGNSHTSLHTPPDRARPVSIRRTEDLASGQRGERRSISARCPQTTLLHLDCMRHLSRDHRGVMLDRRLDAERLDQIARQRLANGAIVQHPIEARRIPQRRISHRRGPRRIIPGLIHRVGKELVQPFPMRVQSAGPPIVSGLLRVPAETKGVAAKHPNPAVTTGSGCFTRAMKRASDLLVGFERLGGPPRVGRSGQRCRYGKVRPRCGFAGRDN